MNVGFTQRRHLALKLASPSTSQNKNTTHPSSSSARPPRVHTRRLPLPPPPPSPPQPASPPLSPRLSSSARAFQDVEALDGSEDVQRRANLRRVAEILRDDENDANAESTSGDRRIDPETDDQIQLESREIDDLYQSIYERFEQSFAEAGLSNAVLSHSRVIADFSSSQ